MMCPGCEKADGGPGLCASCTQALVPTKEREVWEEKTRDPYDWFDAQVTTRYDKPRPVGDTQ